MSNVTLTVVRHRGEIQALGRNVAVRLMLEKSAPRASHRNTASSEAREGWVRSFLRQPRAI